MVVKFSSSVSFWTDIIYPTASNIHCVCLQSSQVQWCFKYPHVLHWQLRGRNKQSLLHWTQGRIYKSNLDQLVWVWVCVCVCGEGGGGGGGECGILPYSLIRIFVIVPIAVSNSPVLLQLSI